MNASKKLLLGSISTALLLMPVVSFAAACAAPTTATAGAWFQCILMNILNMIVWPIFITAAIIMFIWSGILFLSAHGDPGKISDARHALIWAVIGVVVGLLGFVSVSIIRGLIGL